MNHHNLNAAMSDTAKLFNAAMSDTAKLFWLGRSQAVQLPKDFWMDGTEVRIRKQGSAVILEPLGIDWAWLDAIAGEFSKDFLAEGRQQPELPDDGLRCENWSSSS